MPDLNGGLDWHAKIKLQHWRGSWRHLALQGAPVLEF